jgi:cytosine/adenosine deaminase-related metal-dependent hydrolase
MAHIIRGRWGLNQEGIFQDDPWFLVKEQKIVQYGFGKPPNGLKIVNVNDGVILPGLVNAHTHIELSYLKNKTAAAKGVHGFALELMKQARPQMQTIVDHAKNEIQKAVSRGTFFFADISNNPEFIVLLKDLAGFYGIRFLELLGFCTPNDKRRIEMADSFFKINEANAIDKSIFVTPHSIYGSSPDIMNYVQNKNKQIVSIHALEDSEEMDLLHEKGKTFDFLNSIEQYVFHSELIGQDYVSYLEKYCSNVKKLLLVHLTFADEKILKQIETSLPRAAAVLCHRSNVFLGYTRTNWSALENSSIPLLMGTDSTASCSDLSVLDEVLNLINEDKLPAALLWKAATSAAYDYFEIPQSEVPWFLFRGTTPDLSSFAGVQSVNILETEVV